MTKRVAQTVINSGVPVLRWRVLMQEFVSFQQFQPIQRQSFPQIYDFWFGVPFPLKRIRQWFEFRDGQQTVRFWDQSCFWSEASFCRTRWLLSPWPRNIGK